MRRNLVVVFTGPADAASLALYALQTMEMSMLSMSDADEEKIPATDNDALKISCS